MSQKDNQDRAARTTVAARTIIDAETKARNAKTDRLRKLRLAQEAVTAPEAKSAGGRRRTK
ncbi:hypothetical protein RB623_00280 [Mesorhizobium sp. LHD-90]|uniref:hypothetical protein n=1 Tax=Mesorhizobium sp. LHD-90 TaxID=3071414 RepID=UPI0027DF4D43|nr:hypothetical protein [Mesorhizobium sp. LHD-90]MDQ6432485.1 hypothetical protein [Mesorhizobium sp. LHD-90]